MFTGARPTGHGWSATRPSPLDHRGITDMSVALDIAERLKTLTGTIGITYLCVALGSAVGGSARYALSGAVANWIGATFPWGTLIVNITGCFVIGIFGTLTAPNGPLL